jgi:hypothetical protein
LTALRTHPHIGFALAHSSEHGAVVLGARGMHRLADGHVEGEDPLASFAPSAPRHLLRTDGFEHAPDLLVNSFYDPVLEEGCAFRGAHLLPRRARRPADPAVHPASGASARAERADRRRSRGARRADGLARGRCRARRQGRKLCPSRRD